MTTTQAPLNNARVPTPVEISTAFYTVLLEDAKADVQPAIPVRVGSLLRQAIARANAGEFQ